MNSLNHGGTIFQKDLLDFSVNLNSLGMPNACKNLLKNCEVLASIYPEAFAQKFEEAISKKYGVNLNTIISGNGATELISLALSLFMPNEGILVFTPAYIDYKRAILANNLKFIECLRDEKKDFSLNTKIISNAIKTNKPKAVIIGRPNNPVGTPMPASELIQIIQKFSDTMFILDESFIQFMANYNDISLLEENKLGNCIIIRSLTKFYSIPGLRLGFMQVPPKIKEELSFKRLMWSVNGIAQEAGSLILSDSTFEKNSIDYYSNEQKRIYKILSKIKDFKVYYPAANFILLKFKQDTKSLYKYLLTKNIHIRLCNNFDGLNNNYIRIAIKTSMENDLLFNEIKNYLLQNNFNLK